MATAQSGLVSGNSQNEVGGATGRSRSKFPLSYSQFQTERFAEYFPFFVEEGVSGDKLPLHSNHEVQTYTLKSPILQSLSKKKDYFVVPMQAILPLNWEKFYTNPNIGQDVPKDCGLGVEDFWSNMATLFNNSFGKLIVTLNDSSLTTEQKFDAIFHFIFFFEKIYSSGCLMEYLRISAHNFLEVSYRQGATGQYKESSFDDFIDNVFSRISTGLTSTGSSPYSISYSIGSSNYIILSEANTNPQPGAQRVNLREAMEMFRDDLSFQIINVTLPSSFPSEIYGYFTTNVSFTPFASDAPLNLGRLWAYQLVCAHFYSNDHVDFIYSAELFRQYIGQLVSHTYYSGGTYEEMHFSFDVNGLTYQYDYLSANAFDRVLNSFDSSGIFSHVSSSYATNDALNDCYAYFTALFGFKRSLRFMDYFTGSRAYPLAVGSSTVNVNAGKVDVVELSRSSMMTKFLLAVNRSGRKFSSYMKELFGKTPAYDYHNPMYLAHTSDLVGVQETDNTGAAQVDASRNIAVTSRFKASSSRYAFQFEPDRDCIVIGISYYDLPRVYLNSTDKQNFAVDRFDMFNPYLQFIGDQSISEAEIGTSTPFISNPFSYTNRHMEFKQRWNYGCGGFCVPSTGLDNWIFPADQLQRQNFHNISPSFIRSFNSELDRFYQRLTGYSLGTYFHFIVRYDNRQDASRPMAYNPTIDI